MKVIVPLKNAHDVEHSPLEARDIVVTWREESFFIIDSRINPTILTECDFPS
jgi:hypothetical protein